MSDPKTTFVRPAVPEPWCAAEATDRLRKIAVDEHFRVTFKIHAFEQMEVREITVPDVLWAMRIGFVYDAPIPATQPGLYRYTLRGPTPNSNGRDIRVVVIPSMHVANAKIITVMWADEPTVRG
jgi:hypothetical protein